MSESTPLTVGILVFNQVEVLDFTGPFEVFSTARWADQHSEDKPLFNVVIIAETNDFITGRNDFHVKPHATIDNHPPLDILVIPGGPGTRPAINNSRLINWITQQDRQTRLTTSVCTGAFLLAQSKILDNLKATTHWGSIDRMRENFPLVEVLTETRFVDEGHIITSAGVSAGIDMSLHVITRLFGAEAAQWTAHLMEYDWNDQLSRLYNL
jgi:transcriptional regulator GlxA family with amidase domain